MVEWLQWLSYGGGFVALFVILAEKWSWFQELAPELKEIFSSVVVSLGVAAIGLVLYFVSPESLSQGDIYLNVLAAIVFAITGKEILYKQMYK